MANSDEWRIVGDEIGWPFPPSRKNDMTTRDETIADGLELIQLNQTAIDAGVEEAA